MSKVSNYLENAWLDHIHGVSALTHIATPYLALFTSDPTDAGSGTEVSGGSYARQAVTMAKNGTRAAHNSAQVTYTPSGANFGTVTHFAIFDASTAGNMLYHGALDASKIVNDGETLTVAANAVDVTVNAGGQSDYAADKMLSHTLGIASYTAPSAVYTGIYTTDPGADNSGTEVSGGSYARQETAFDAASSGVSANTDAETFTASGAGFGTVTHRGTLDASTAGNLLFYAALNSNAVIGDGDSLPFEAGSIQNTLD